MAFKRALPGAYSQIRIVVPDPYRLVRAAGRKKPAVGREDHGVDATPAKSLKKVVLT
jgi:hypothetical protein